MRRLHPASLALLAITMTADPASPQVTVADGYSIEVFANTPDPSCLAIPTGASTASFGSRIYFCRTVWDGGGTTEPDMVRRVDLATRVVEDFFGLCPESDPLALAFGPGAPYTTQLYVSENNRDNYQPGDNGGAIVFLAPDPTVLGEQFLTAQPPLNPSEPVDLVFTPGGAWGTELLMSNASDTPFDIARVLPSGSLVSFVKPPPTISHLRLAFAPGNAWGTDLFVTAAYGNDTNKIYRVDPNGVSSLWSAIPGFSVGPDLGGSLAFDPGTRFGGDLFLFVHMGGKGRVLRVSSTGQFSTFVDNLVGIFPIQPGIQIMVQDGLVFAPDGSALFIADTDADVIYRVTPVWIDLGSGLAGVNGIPKLTGAGSLAAGSSNSLVLTSAKASALALLFVSFASTPAPFKGGTLVTVPVSLSFNLGTDASGALTLPFTWPAGVPSATSLYLQYAVQDAAAPQGASLSNALKGITP